MTRYFRVVSRPRGTPAFLPGMRHSHAAGSCQPARAPVVLAGPQLAIAAALFVAVWLLVLDLCARVPPMDNLEQLVWVHAAEWGYHKHPPLPTLLLWPFVRALGYDPWITYVLGASAVVGAVAVQWDLLTRMRGRAYAGVGAAAMLCITYYNGRLNFFNHNTVLMFWWSLAAWCAWRASNDPRPRWWIALGLVLGLAGLTKYEAAVAACSALAWWLWDRGWRSRQGCTGLALATFVALALFAPHAHWLLTHDFAPVRYAGESSLNAGIVAADRPFEALWWVLDELFNRALPAWLLLAFTCIRRVRTPAIARTPMDSSQARSRAFLLIWGLTPLVFVVLVGIVGGAELQAQWGTPFLFLLVPAALELVARDAASCVSARRLCNVFCVIQVLLLCVNVLTAPSGTWPSHGHWRGLDAAKLAHALEVPAQRALEGPICVLSGPTALAGAVSLHLRDHPLVLIKGDFGASPWVDPRRARACGIVEISETGGAGNAVLAEYPQVRWKVVRGSRAPAVDFAAQRKVWP